MNGKQLKNSILQLAIQGKLVPQDPKDESASVLLESIRKEKERLFKESKLKKKDLVSTPITEEEKPFEIPQTWKWVRLGEISTFNGGYAFKSINYVEKNQGIRVLRISDFSGNGILNNSPVYHPIDTKLSKFLLEKDDIVICMTGGTVGKSCHIKTLKEPFYVNQRVADIKVNKFAIPDYIYKVITSSYIQEQISEGKNSTNDNISSQLINEFLIPLPPLAEQHRIVEKIEELMPLIEEYDNAQKQLDRLNADLPEALKKSILQEAIQGKLVPQDPKDEPASVLLESIRKEKERLFKEGKLKKKDLVTTPITEDEKPFEIPTTWEWVRLGEVFSHSNGKQLNRADTQGEYNDYITTSNLYWDRFDLKNIRQMRFTSDELIRYTATKGDLLICEGGDVGRSAIWDKNYNICIQNHIHRARAYYPLCTRFFLYIFMFNKSVGLIGGKGIGIQGLSAKVLHNILLPLPPLAEQHRIVEKIEELFAKLK